LLRHDPSGGSGVDSLLMRCPRPWPPSLVDGLLAALGGPAEQLGGTWRISNLCRLAATRLPTDCTDRFTALATATRAHASELGDRLARSADLPGPSLPAAPGGAVGGGSTAPAARDRGLDASDRRRLSAVQEL